MFLEGKLQRYRACRVASVCVLFRRGGERWQTVSTDGQHRGMLGCSVGQFVCCLGKGVDSVSKLTITEVC